MSNTKKVEQRKWRIRHCWVCGCRFRQYPDNDGKFDSLADSCPDCHHCVEIVERLMGASMPGTLFILRSLAYRIKELEHGYLRHLKDDHKFMIGRTIFGRTRYG